MSETNQATKLKFGVLAGIYTYYGYMYIFYAWGVYDIKSPTFL